MKLRAEGLSRKSLVSKLKPLREQGLTDVNLSTKNGTEVLRDELVRIWTMQEEQAKAAEVEEAEAELARVKAAEQTQLAAEEEEDDHVKFAMEQLEPPEDGEALSPVYEDEVRTRDWETLKSNAQLTDGVLYMNMGKTFEARKQRNFEPVGGITPENFNDYFEEKTLKFIKDAFNELGGGIKFTFSLHIEMQRVGAGQVENPIRPMFIRASKSSTITDASTISEEYHKQYDEILHKFDNPDGPSNLVLYSTLRAYLRIDKFKPIAGGAKLRTPEFLKNKGIISVDDQGDNRCFQYAILACFKRPEKHADRRNQYNTKEEYQNIFNFGGIEYPTPCEARTFRIFEVNNPEYGLNVFTCPANGTSLSSILPFYISPYQDRKILSLMLLIEGGENGRKHYISIVDFKKLMCDGQKTEHATCPRCMYTFRGKSKVSSPDERLAEHMKICQGANGECQRVEFPKEGSKKYFEGYEKLHKKPYTIFADFESSLMEVNVAKGEKSTLVREHVANSFCFIVIGPDGLEVPEFRRFYRGENAALKCITDLKEVSNLIAPLLNLYRDHHLTAEEEAEFLAATTCYMCKREFVPTDKNKKACRDHCHTTGAYRGAACNRCNLKCTVKREVDVYFHNGKNYDNHLLMRELHNLADDKFDVIATNSEKYISFSIYHKSDEGAEADDERKQLRSEKRKVNNKLKKLFKVEGELDHESLEQLEDLQLKQAELEEDLEVLGDSERSMKIVFKDSCQFLTASLSDLVKNTPVEDLKNTHSLAAELKISMDLLTKKGIYPYSFVNSMDKFEQPTLPTQEEFYDDLNNEACSNKDYEHAQTVWEAMKCSTFGDYHNMYLMLDVYLLADVFTNFRNFAHATYGLDPAHSFTLPGFSWEALFAARYKGAKKRPCLELITDPDMYAAFESSLRGGVCVASNRYVEANHPALPDYDESKPNKHIRYDDANNLYGHAMVQKLPISDFRWAGNIEVLTPEYILSIDDEDDYGMHLCVDVEYPDELHDEHGDFPLMPESRLVQLSELSPHSQAQAPEKYTPCQKLVPNLYNKEKYWIHYRNLKYALQMGLKLLKVHKAIVYKQEAWMAPYIMFNTNMRTQARNDFEKDLYKLMNNSVFGKTMQNLRLQRNFRILSTSDVLWGKIISSPRYKGRGGEDGNCIGGDLYVLEQAKATLLLKMPMYVGASILDLSKLHMQKFWYDFVRPRYPNAKLHYTDTDSLIYSIETADDLATSFKGVEGSMFDTSGYPKEHAAFSNDNKKVLGKFKDEADGVPILAVCCLAPKSYTMKTMKNITKKCKGTKKAVVKKEIQFDDYKTCLMTGEGKFNSQKGFRSFGHTINTVETRKQSLNSFDSKRFWLNEIESLPLGHYKCFSKSTAKGVGGVSPQTRN
jgi:hypothetical protein